MKKSIAALLVSALALMPLFGCGGGGGGGPAPADITGRVLLVSTGQAPGVVTVAVGSATAQSDAGGVFTVHGASSAATQIMVTGTGLKALTQTLPTLTPNAVNDLGDIFVVDTASGTDYTSTASGTVVRSDNGQPVAGAVIHLSGQVFTTTSTGAFQFSNLPNGLGNNLAQVGLIKATGFEDKQIFIDPPLGKSPPDNQLGPIALSPPVGAIPPGPTDIRGIITVQGLTDLSGTTVTLVNKATGAPAGNTTTAADGSYGFFVTAGTYTVQAKHTGFAAKQQDVTLARPDQPQTVSFTLTP